MGLVARARTVGDFHATVLHFTNAIGGLDAQLGGIFTKVLLCIAIVLFGLEFFIHRHGVVSTEESFMFPALYGFLAFLFIVQIGKWLRPMIMRKEDYYD